MTEETDLPPEEPAQTPAPDANDQTPAPEPESQQDPEPQPEPEPKREPWFQKRIDKLTHDKRELERQLQAAQDLLQRGPQEPNPDKPLTEAEVERRATQKAQQLAAEDAQRARAAAFNERCDKVYEAGKGSFSDFDAAVGNLNAAGVMGADFLEAVLETDAPEKVIHNLGQNPEEAMRIAALPPRKQAVELDRLAAKVAKPAERQISKAPNPPNPITGGAKSAFDPSAPDANISEWIKWREADLAKRGKRI